MLFNVVGRGPMPWLGPHGNKARGEDLHRRLKVVLAMAGGRRARVRCLGLGNGSRARAHAGPHRVKTLGGLPRASISTRDSRPFVLTRLGATDQPAAWHASGF